MAATSDIAAGKEHNSFPVIPPETRMMMRSIPYSHLRGYGSPPDVPGARAKVDSRNPSYLRARSKSTETCVRRGVMVSSTKKADYSHVTSKTDTGRRKSGEYVVQRMRSQSATVTEPVSLAAQLSSSRRKLAQLKRAATQPFLNPTSGALMTGDSVSGAHSRSRKISAPVVSSRQSRERVKSRVDCRDPHPEITKQTHTLQELQIIQDTKREELNPRFQPPAATTSHSLLRSSGKSRKSSLPGNFGRSTTGQHTGGRQAKLQRRVTVASANISSSSVTERKEDRPLVGGSAKIPQSPQVVATTGEEREMEVLRQVPAALESRGDDNEEGDFVKMKPRNVGMRCTHGSGICQSHHNQPHIHQDLLADRGSSGEATSYQDSVTGDWHHQQCFRDSLSSSESVGVIPEHSSMELDTDAFSVEPEHEVKLEEHRDYSWGEHATGSSDKIVGFEVSTDSKETTVNLLHLLGHKNKSVEQTQTDYQNHELWVIGEENEEESEDEMEEEIYLSDGASGGDPETITLAHKPVPQLFIVDENDDIIEKVKTGRRKQSRGSVSDSHPTSTSATDCQLSLHTLTLHD